MLVLFGIMGIDIEFNAQHGLAWECPVKAETSTATINYAIVCTAAGLGISASFSGIHTLQIKESNRIIALQTELRKLGLRSDYNAQEDMLHIHKGQLKPYKGILRTYNDHRIAMALAPLSLLCGDLHLEDGDVVGKSFPSFWEQLEKLGFVIERVSIKNEI